MPVTRKHDGASRKLIACLRVPLHEALAKKKGAPSVAAAARLHGIGRQAMFDYRAGRAAPRLELAMQMAKDLDTTVEKLFTLRRGATRA
jgi:DNA-binding XRE family transcriptional regulator